MRQSKSTYHPEIFYPQTVRDAGWRQDREQRIQALITKHAAYASKWDFDCTGRAVYRGKTTKGEK